jgi:RHS repeat-associated protein
MTRTFLGVLRRASTDIVADASCLVVDARGIAGITSNSIYQYGHGAISMDNRLTIVLTSIVVLLLSTNAFAAVGRTAGQFSVSPTGGAHYTIPIWTPPGVRGVQPHLALVYDSQSPYGIIGPGWTLSGLSAITRCNRTIAQDGAAAPVTLTYADAFCLDGSRLRLTSSDTLSTYGQGGTTYQTEIANFSNVIASTALAGNGPEYFTVQGKDGLTYEYGNTTDSRELASGATTPYAWALDKVTDRYGNRMTFTYTQANGSYVPATINFTAPSGSSTFPYQVTFSYTTRVSGAVINQYIANYAVQNTQQLSNINVTSSGTSVRQYKLTFTASATTTYPTLTQIQECGGSAGTDCLSPTNVGYQGGAPGFTAPTTAAVPATAAYYSGGLVNSADIDGDGKQDLIYAVASGTNDQWYVKLATASGYGPAIYTGLTTKSTPNGPDNVLFDDFLGTGQNEILAPNGGMWTIYKYNGSGFTATSTGIAVDPNLYTGQVATADLDGDGLPDLITMPIPGLGNGTISWRRNTSTGTTVSFVSAATAIHSVVNSQTLPQIRGNNGFPNSEVKHMRFGGTNSDGILLERALLEYPGGPVLDIVEAFTYVNGTLAIGIQTNGPMSYVLPLNFNDDACTDLATTAGIPPASLSIMTGCTGNQIIVPYGIVGQVAAMDWDGDGRTDLIFNSGGSLVVYRSQGNSLSAAISTGISAGNGSYLVFDKDGDGLSDLGFINSSASNAVSYGLHNAAGVTPDLADAFVDGYGLATKPSYVSIAQSGSGYTSYHDSAFPYFDYFGPLEVVSSVVYTDPSNAATGTYTQTLLYSAMWKNLQGRGLTPFQAVQNTDSRNGFSLYSNYSRLFPYTGMKEGFYFADPNSYPVAQGSALTWNTTPLDSTPNNQRYFPYVMTDYKYDYELRPNSFGTAWITETDGTYAYDNYGNPTNITTTVKDTDPTSPYLDETWTTTTVSGFSPNTSTWCLDLPTQTTVTRSNISAGGAAITRTISYPSPDYTNCRQNQKVVEPSSATYKVTFDYGYDTQSGNFGNLVSQAVTGVGMAARKTLLNWGTTGQFLTTVTNPLSQTTTFGYDPNSGMLTSAKDPNLLTTSWQYDNFARKTKESRPDTTSTTWAYNDCATAGCVNSNNKMTVVQTRVNTDGTTLRLDNNYLDAFDRTLVTSAEMPTGAFNRIETQYDSLGNMHLQGAPCLFASCTQYWTTNTYDALHRLIESQRPISATNSTLQSTIYGYAGRTLTVTDPQLKVTKTISHVTGDVGRTIDHNGYYVDTNRDSFGSVLSMKDSLSNTLWQTPSYNYGIAPFLTSSVDMDLGSWSYTVDPLGEVTNYTDANKKSFSALYDALSRPTQRIEPDMTTTWTWGNTAASHNIGQLASVNSDTGSLNYTENYGFDSFGRLSSKQFVLPVQGTYQFAYAYDANTGLLQSAFFPYGYPSNYRVEVAYSYQHGILSQLSNALNPSTVWWQATATNPRGQIMQENTGDASTWPRIVSNHTYDAVTGWLSTIQTGVTAGAALQNQSYLYDEMGNVQQRQDNNAGLTENFYYDNLYRLDHSVLGSTTNLQMRYDAMGNITSRSDVAAGATWTYDPTHKHQVTQAGSSSFTYAYDANGNVKTRNGTALTWTSYNYPSDVATSTEGAAFDYGPNRQRWRTTYTSSAGTETTYYASNAFEIVATAAGTDYRHYISANGRPVVVISRTSGGSVNVRSLLTDHQGSVSEIVQDQTSAPYAYAKESFSAFGNRREASTWTGVPTSGELTSMNGVTREGYTFQTVLGSMGLNHMNGRVQDAITGRFLSADPHGPNGSTQSYNRYSYVNNNPLSFTDPSGFYACGSMPAAACRHLNADIAQGVAENAKILRDFNAWAFSIADENNGWVGVPSVSWGDAGEAPTLSGTGVSQSPTGMGQSPWPGPNNATAGGASGSNAAGGGGGGLVTGSATFQICTDGICSAEINPDGPQAEEAPANLVQMPFNYASFAAAATQINMGRTITQFVGGTAGLAAAGATSAFAGIGAVYGGIGGYQARGWQGVAPGAVIGAALGGAGGLAGDALAEAGVTGLWGVGAVSLTGAASGGLGAYGVNVLTGNPNSFQGVGSAALIGLMAPYMSGEAFVVGGAGIGGAGAYSLNALSGAFTVGAAAAIPP